MKTRFLSSVLALCMAAPLLADATEGVVNVEILPGWRTAEGTHMAGLSIRLAPGWKTYWRAPGDGGIPPQFAWNGSQNISGAAFHWPVPDVFDQGGVRAIGYAEHVVIPVELTLPDTASPALMRGEVQLGVCLDICVPVFLSFSAELPPTGARNASIVAALVDRPQTAREAGVGPVTCAIEPIADGLRVTARMPMAPLAAGQAENVVIETGDQEVWVSEPQAWREGGELLARSDLMHVLGRGFAVDRSQLRITVLSGGRSVDIQGCGAG